LTVRLTLTLRSLGSLNQPVETGAKKGDLRADSAPGRIAEGGGEATDLRKLVVGKATGFT